MIFKLPKDAPVTGFDEFGEDVSEHDLHATYKDKKKSKRLARELKRRQVRLNK
jgi:hypothetical protein